MSGSDQVRSLLWYRCRGAVPIQRAALLHRPDCSHPARVGISWLVAPLVTAPLYVELDRYFGAQPSPSAE